ncbi:MAG: hypothetical protein ACLVGA_13290 [Dysosmobacter sp.]
MKKRIAIASDSADSAHAPTTAAMAASSPVRITPVTTPTSDHPASTPRASPFLPPPRRPGGSSGMDLATPTATERRVLQSHTTDPPPERTRTPCGMTRWPRPAWGDDATRENVNG